MATNVAALPFEEAWSNYRGAIEELYGASLAEIATTPGFRLNEPGEEQVESAFVASESVAQVLTVGMESDDGDREVGIIRLLAAATIDLSIANDLAPFDPQVGYEQRGATVLASTLGESLLVLDSASEEIFQRLIIAGGAPMTIDEAKQHLEQSATAATQGILSDTSSAAIAAISILLGPAIGAGLHEAVGQPIDAIFDHLNRPRWAIKFVRNGVKKVMTTLDGFADDVRRSVGEWAENEASELGSGFLEQWLANRYQANQMIEAVRAQIETTDKSSEALARAASDLDILAAKFHGQMRFVRHTAWLVSHARRFLFHIAPPWSEIAVLAGAVVTTGCVVCIGDDYLDGPTGGGIPRLRMIRGVMPIVVDAL